MGAILLAATLASLWFAATRLVSANGIVGLPRFLAVNVSVAAAMAAEALVLGFVGLGADPAALVPVSLALALAARRLLPEVERPAHVEALDAWERMGIAERAALGAAAGLLGMWAGLTLIEPSLDIDSAFLHLPEVSAWVRDGHPGSLVLISPSFPLSNYPSTNEVLMSWLGGVSGGVTAVLLWPLWLTGLLATAIVSASRTFGARPRDAALAAAAFLLLPLVTAAVTGLDSDLPSACWAIVCVALCAPLLLDRERTELAPFAIVAFGLAIGTKTSVAVLVVLVLGATLIRARRELRIVPVALGFAAATVVGGVWYLRNLVDHGNPLWPFVDLPGSDPLIGEVDEVGGRFIQHPISTLDGRVGDYLDILGPAPLMILAAILLPIAARNRRLLVGALVVAIGALAWSMAPVTGDPGTGTQAAYFSVTGVRYMLSAILSAAVVLAAVAGRGGRIPGSIARLVLVAAVVWGLVDLLGGGDGLPEPLLVVGSAVGGGLVAVAVGQAGRVGLFAPAAIALVAVGVALVIQPGKFVTRYADTAGIEDPLSDTRALYGDVAGWFQTQPDFRDGDGPIVMSNLLIGPLTGGGFDHSLRLVTDDVGCDELREQAAGGWALLSAPGGVPGTPEVSCFAGDSPVYDQGGIRVFVVPG